MYVYLTLFLSIVLGLVASWNKIICIVYLILFFVKKIGIGLVIGWNKNTVRLYSSQRDCCI